MAEPAYFRALGIVVSDFYLRDDGAVPDLRQHFLDVHKEFTGEDFRDHKVIMGSEEDGDLFTVFDGESQIADMNSTGICVHLPFISYARVSTRTRLGRGYSPTGALIFYLEGSTPEESLYVRGHEEGHALAIAKATSALEEKLVEMGRPISFRWDVGKGKEGGSEILANIAGLYALERAGYKIEDLYPEQLGMGAEWSELFKISLNRYLCAKEDPEIDVLPKNACQLINKDLGDKLRVMEQINPSVRYQGIFFLNTIERTGTNFWTNQPSHSEVPLPPVPSIEQGDGLLKSLFFSDEDMSKF